MRTFLDYSIIITVWFGVVVGCAAPQTQPVVYAKLKEASVEILVNGRLAGSGSVVDAQGHVFIANHMVPGDEATVEAQSTALGRHPIQLVARDRAHDLLLLKLPARDQPYPHLSLAKANTKAGQPVYLFGAPVFRHHVMISGTVARDRPTFEFYEGAFREILHISAISPIGTSGGPWVNVHGELIGVQSAAMTINGAHQGIAYAAPLASLRRLLKKKETVHSATMQTGVEELWGQEPKFIAQLPQGVRGLVVRQLRANGVAAKAGLKEWDVIVAADGKPVERTKDLLNRIRAKQPGQHIKLRATDRMGKNSREITIKLSPIR
ncbi:S1C family serine protease [Verrucomicrobia bacterium]|nr:S1C family serine protease [Verrucomicrobiota bacterium]MDC0219877.1 S1C family serine protease [Verrucomicrobiota bacterium]